MVLMNKEKRDQQNRIKNPEIHLHKYTHINTANWPLIKTQSQFSEEKAVFMTFHTGTTGHSHAKMMTDTQKSLQIINLSVKYETMKILREDIGKFMWLWVGIKFRCKTKSTIHEKNHVWLT